MVREKNWQVRGQLEKDRDQSAGQGSRGGPCRPEHAQEDVLATYIPVPSRSAT